MNSVHSVRTVYLALLILSRSAELSTFNKTKRKTMGDS